MVSMSPSPQYPLRKITLNYLLFSVLSSLCIVHAVLFGITGRFLPPLTYLYMDRSFSFLLLFVRRLYIVLLPLFIVLVLNTILFSRIFSTKSDIPRRRALRGLLGVLVAFPILFLVVYIFPHLGLIASWPEVVIVQNIVVVGFLMIYVLLVTAITSGNTTEYLIRALQNSRVWMAALVLCAVLVFPSMALINPIQKGFYYYFPSTDHFFSYGLPDLLGRTFGLGVLIPLLPLALQYIKRNSAG